jgi:hypothetical protein
MLLRPARADERLQVDFEGIAVLECQGKREAAFSLEVSKLHR